MKVVYCLYRVSTKGQVDHDDIPMQRTACRAFAEKMGWTVCKEFYEKGVSGYKVSAEERDAIQDLKIAAKKREFDILLVFMFDRLGRIPNETPFVLEWFVKMGIEVWSAKEGQQTFDTDVDYLMNYIRFWQAGGKTEKHPYVYRLVCSRWWRRGSLRAVYVRSAIVLSRAAYVTRRGKSLWHWKWCRKRQRACNSFFIRRSMRDMERGD